MYTALLACPMITCHLDGPKVAKQPLPLGFYMNMQWSVTHTLLFDVAKFIVPNKQATSPMQSMLTQQ